MSNNKERPFFHIHHQKDYEREKFIPPPRTKMHRDGLNEQKRVEFSSALKSGAAVYWQNFFNAELPVFGCFTMKDDSLSKSSRTPLINSLTLKVISNIGLNKFLFTIKDGSILNRMAERIEHSSSKSLGIALSYVAAMGVYLPDDKMSTCIDSLLDSKSDKIWLKLFPSAHDKINLFHNYLESLNINKFKQVDIYPDSGTDIQYTHIPYYIEITDSRWKDKLHSLFLNSLVQTALLPSEISFDLMDFTDETVLSDSVIKREHGHNYPKVAILDSGVSSISYLNEWKIAHENYVPDDYTDCTHGTFVAGRALMLDDSPKFGGIEFLDIKAVPSKKSGIAFTIEDLKNVLEDNLEKYSETIKVWNLSIGVQNKVVSLDEFSEVAKMLDALQYKYKVVFVIAAGNFHPGSSDYLSLDPNTRITYGAESVHSITVGSISHMLTGICPKDYPSPFSRHGRGPNYIIKPDLVEFGGTLEKRNYKYSQIIITENNEELPTGVVSINSNNYKHYDCGTSYSTPLVSGMLACVYDEIKSDKFSILAARTLLIHHASTTFKSVNHETAISFCGWGKPASMEQMLYSDEDEATLVYEGFMPTDQEIVIEDIPIPKSMLEEGKLKGEISMTAVYMPPTVPSMSCLYTAIDLDFKIGYYDTENEWSKVIRSSDMVTGILPKQSEYFEKQRIEYGFKWHPVKKYHRAMRGIGCPETLLLKVVAIKREFYHSNLNVPFCVAITFKRKGKKVYETIKQQLEASHLTVSQARLKVQI